MHRLVILLVLGLTLTGCTVVDFGVARETCPAHWSFNAIGGYADVGWPANSDLLSADVLGGPNSGALVSVDLWRLLHLEVGLLGLGIGIGPLQIGGGVGFYTPHAPAMISGANPFVCEDGKK